MLMGVVDNRGDVGMGDDVVGDAAKLCSAAANASMKKRRWRRKSELWASSALLSL